MKRDDIVNTTEKWLKQVPDIKQKIRLIDVALKSESYDASTIEKLKQRRHKLYSRLSTMIKAVGTLNEENQRMICYRYFEKLTYKAIAQRVGYTEGTIPRRIKVNLIDIGRAIFGMEDEFWEKVLN